MANVCAAFDSLDRHYDKVHKYLAEFTTCLCKLRRSRAYIAGVELTVLNYVTERLSGYRSLSHTFSAAK